MFNPRRGAANRAPGFAIWFLLAEMARFGFDRIPPVTLITILAQVGIHLRDLIRLQRYLPVFPMHLKEVCVSSFNVWFREDWRRLLLAAFYHGDDMHLYFNMTSMLWKGVKLERKLGSARFAAMVAVFSVLINAVLVALGLAADQLLNDGSYIMQCGVGFSGVLFALKVIANHMDPPGVEYVMGMFPVPTKLVCWAELILIHVLVPNASFIGHLAGILVGLLYVYGPLKFIFDLIFEAGRPRGAYQPYSGTTGYRYRAGQNFGGGTTGNAGPSANPRHGYNYYDNNNTNNGAAGAPPPAYNEYTTGADEDEQLARAMEESLRDAPYNGGVPVATYATPTAPVPRAGLYPDLSTAAADPDELRRRRLQRFT